MQEREPLRRFERPHPNQLWQMDLKEDVAFPFGKAHLVAIIDDASRFCLGGPLAPQQGGASGWGLPEAMLTDRASIFYGRTTRQAGLTTYQLALDSLGVRAAFAAPYKPRTKGKVEKFIQTVQHEFLWELESPPATLSQLNQCWEQWLDTYNHRRPHSSLGNLPPAHRFRAPRARAPREVRQLLQVEAMRKVGRDCTISLKGTRYPLPPHLIGKHVWVGTLGDTITVEHAGAIVAQFTM